MRIVDVEPLEVVTYRGESEDFDRGVRFILEMLDALPTIDAVPVVRCKDCKHKTVTSEGMVCECTLPTKHITDYYIYGSVILASVKADDFCSHGERREENADN